MDPKHDFAERLNAILDRYDYPAKHHGRHTRLANEFDVSPRTASNWLNGIKYPEESRIILICKRFNLSRDWLLTGLGMPNPLTDEESRLISCVRELDPGAKAAIYRAAQVEPTPAAPNTHAA